MDIHISDKRMAEIKRTCRQIDRIHRYILAEDAKHVVRAGNVRDRLYSRLGRNFWMTEGGW